jgi:hypothetical protein
MKQAKDERRKINTPEGMSFFTDGEHLDEDCF